MQSQNAAFLLGPEDASRACLLIHGFSGSPAEMLGLGEVLAAQGMRVYGVALAGHSGNPDELIASGRKQWLASVEEGLTKLAHYPRLFVIGLSMGGVLALLAGIKHPDRIAGVVALSTPTSFYDSWPARAVPLLRYVMKWYYPLERMDFSNPRVQAEILQQAHLRDPHASIDFSDPQAVASIKKMVKLPIPALAELFLLTDHSRRQLKKLTTPLLIIQSHKDQTVKPSNANDLYRRTSAAEPKRIYWLQTSDHLIVAGPEREEVFTQISDFIDVIDPAGAKPEQSQSVQTVEPDENPDDH
ncbi:alpha/beta hydrolase [Dictyobacter alpinus]|uniref:Alpha/beta hydrolase n=1 Tax=Dictyobacter alpinus TaxID=2014873 RepID=A0A402BCJ6_9CHLR|nr:alpha/beta fold hydrolase [Dictyobacter alpinus]GCE29085.1 alpha/beta hydrolase [Dictyobacter alpinus]